MPEGAISIDDPRARDIGELLERHLEFANLHSPPEDVHALDLDGLVDPAVTFFAFRLDGELLGVGALEQIDEDHVEVKSMHTAQEREAAGSAERWSSTSSAWPATAAFARVSLETGSMPAFAPARALYASVGFRPCGPFGDYGPSPNSTFMTLSLSDSA